MPKASKRDPYNEYRPHLIPYAYHEAGHAVVGHIIGRCIEEVSIASGDGTYRGYCRFSPFIEEANKHPQWLDTSNNPELITIYYAGMLAMAYFCAAHEGEYEYIEGSEQSDLEKIDQLLAQMGTSGEQNADLRDACWKQAQDILSSRWDVVNEVATRLLEQGKLTGRNAHDAIWKFTGGKDDDWRAEVL